MTLWSEPVGLTFEGERGGSTEPSIYGQSASHSVRRFVIAIENNGHSLCV
jgi:hypothetical protein